MKILMVCLGNICRSPLAEGILRSKLPNIIIDSAGTAAYHVGNSPDIRSIEIAEKYNIDLTNQRARQFNSHDFNNFDKIYAMDSDNYSKIISLAKNQKEINKVDLILNETFPKQFRSVPDPYYGGEQGFENIFLLINNACDIIAEKYDKR
jgi:protein-tyrosine phosphatase